MARDFLGQNRGILINSEHSLNFLDLQEKNLIETTDSLLIQQPDKSLKKLLLSILESDYTQNRKDKQMCGFLNQTETNYFFNDTNGSVTNAGTSVPAYSFQLSAADTSWTYYLNGVRHTITGNKTVALSGSSPPSAANYFITIDNSSGNLVSSTTVWDLTNPNVIPVTIIMFDNSATPKYWIAEERHSILIDRRTHYYDHNTIGTKLLTLGALSGYTIKTESNAANTFGIASCKIADEDIINNLAELTDPNGSTDDYVVFYRTSPTTWAWKKSYTPFSYTNSSYIEYDNNGTMTTGKNNSFYTSYLILTNLKNEARFICINGRGEYSSLTNAEAEDLSSFSWSGLPIAEFVVVYKFIWKAATSYSTSGKVELWSAPAAVFSGRIVLSVTGTGSSYASNIIVDSAGFDGNLATTDDTVQKCLQKLDDLVIPDAFTGGTITENLLVYTSAPTITFDKSGISAPYTSNLEFDNMRIRYIYTDSLASYQLNICLSIGDLDGGGYLIPTLNIGNSVVTIGALTWDGSSIFQINGNRGIVINPAGGTSDVSAFVCASDTGSLSSKNIMIGTNSSTYNNATYNSGGANDSFIKVLTGHLAIITESAKDIGFYLGGATTTNEVMKIYNVGNVTIGRAAISTSATDGFLYTAACAGEPTGTPTTYTGRVPSVYDSTNDTQSFYNTVWRSDSAQFTTANCGGYISGQYIDNCINATPTSGNTSASNQLTLMPFQVWKDVTVDRVGLNVTVGYASSNFQILIYDSDPVTGWARNRLLKTGNISSSGTGYLYSSSTFTFRKGVRYWIGCHTSAGIQITVIQLQGMLNLGLTGATAVSHWTALRKTVTFGNAPATFTFGGTGDLVTVVGYSIRMRVQ